MTYKGDPLTCVICGHLPDKHELLEPKDNGKHVLCHECHTECF